MKEKELLTPESVVESLGIGVGSVGITGTIRKYFKERCVIAYAKTIHYCYMIIKTKRKYIGLFFMGGKQMYSYFTRAEQRSLSDVMEGIKQTRYIERQDIDERYINDITARMV